MLKKSIINLVYTALFFIGSSFLYANDSGRENQLVVLPNTQICGIDFIHFSDNSVKMSKSTSHAVDTKHIYLLNNTTFVANEAVWEQVKIVQTNAVKTQKKSIANPLKTLSYTPSVRSAKAVNIFQDAPFKGFPSKHADKQFVAASVSFASNNSKLTTETINVTAISFDVSYPLIISQKTTHFGSEHTNTVGICLIQTTRPPPMA